MWHAIVSICTSDKLIFESNVIHSCVAGASLPVQINPMMNEELTEEQKKEEFRIFVPKVEHLHKLLTMQFSGADDEKLLECLDNMNRISVQVCVSIYSTLFVICQTDKLYFDM